MTDTDTSCPPTTQRPCPPPRPELEAADFELPPDACDTHSHVIASDALSYPLVAQRSYTPPAATEQSYLAMLDAQGMARGVLVQISVHGTDNRYMVEVLRRHPDRLRGVAVVGVDVTDRELEALHAAGVRGLRINVLFGGGIGFDTMETLARRIAPLGWHMQFLADFRGIDPDLLRRMARLPCPGVIDHVGYAPAAQGTGSAAFRTLLGLVKDAGYWVKLSGAYIISNRAFDYEDAAPLVQTLAAVAPDRMLWGSDWPHVCVARMPDTGHLRNLFGRWIASPALRRQILVDNPARLYGFPARP